jgi:hypothetical protein
MRHSNAIAPPDTAIYLLSYLLMWDALSYRELPALLPPPDQCFLKRRDF